MSSVVEQSEGAPARAKARSCVFSHLAELLSHYAQIAPERDAILGPGFSAVRYGPLARAVSETVRELRHRGIGRRDRLAVVLPNGPDTAVAMIAAASAAVCVPLNPALTDDEWQRYLVDFQIAALLTRPELQSAARTVAHDLGIPVIDLIPQLGGTPGTLKLQGSRMSKDGDGALAPRAEDDALILLTSGTTSRPKLVPLTHANICRSAYNAGAVLALEPDDRLLNALPLFHAHGLISGLLTALAAGSTVICTPRFEPDTFLDWLAEFRPTWYTAVPSIHRALLSAASRRNRIVAPCSLRVIRSASASLPPAVLAELESVFGVPVIETYGMTEAASQIAANPLKRRKPGSVGRPAGSDIAILDTEGQHLAAGARGEIAIRGPTLTRGYENDGAATQAAFKDGWFRTGDLGYLDRDGYLFIVGRLKDAIKRGGQQVAPAEVEAVLLRHPDVVEAAVFSIAHRSLGEDVAAAVVLRPGSQTSVQVLRSFARERLARYKVPGPIRIVPHIPKNASGKIVRGELGAALSLVEPEVGATNRPEEVAPRSALEGELAEAWAELLEIPGIAINQDVFELGADSLTVTQMLSRVRKRFDAELSFKDMFDAPTVEALATRIEAMTRSPSIAPLTLAAMPADPARHRLSFQQQRIQILGALDPTGHTYHVVEVVRLAGPLDPDALDASIARICDRHEVLRSAFDSETGEATQSVGAARPQLERLDLRAHRKARKATIIRKVQELARRPFDLRHEPPMRARLLRVGDNDHALVITLHHLVTDGWSQRLFWKELEALYGAAVNATTANLPDLPLQYRHFAEWQRAWLKTPSADSQLGYWRRQLAGLTELPLRIDRPRPRNKSGHGARHPVRFSKALSARIKALSREHRVTLFMTLLAAFQILLHRYTQRDDIAVGSMIANRNQIQTENLIGMFANTIVLRTDLSGDPRFSELLLRVRQMTLDAYRNQDLPFEEILRSLRASRGGDGNTLFQVMFILQNPSLATPAFSGLTARAIDVDPGVARVDLMLELFDADAGLYGWFEYCTDLFDSAIVARMAAQFQTLVRGIVANAEERISRLPVLPPREREQVLTEWNETDVLFPGPRTFAARFARQVMRTPNATAVSAGRTRVSYRELARRSSAIREQLVQRGIGSDDVVVLLAPRGINLLAGMIAVQQTAAAFLSLDPKLPPARLAQIIRHSRTSLVLADRGCTPLLKRAFFEAPAPPRLQVLSLAKLVRGRSRKPIPPHRPTQSSLAYVIYTSGSTGTPKGAMVEQRGLTNHLLSKISELELSSSDVVAQTAPQTFDISVWQFLAALMVGGRVHILADEVVRDPTRLAHIVRREGVTLLQVVPSLLRAILDRLPDRSIFDALSRLRRIVCIGEALPPDLCRDWLRYFPAVPLINAYGPAECADTVATYRLAQSPAATVPIGRPIANTRLYVLDAQLQPVPIAVSGELWVGGAGVGRGYLNDPELTARNFLPDPFSSRRGARLYRTGDLARWRADGSLEFLGRVDHQVKIRGYRIELEEIEHHLIEHPDVDSAVVLVRETAAAGAQLVACLVPAARRTPEPNKLRNFLRPRLPEYMIPTGFIALDRLPLTDHGKVDRSALAAIRQQPNVAATQFVPPRDSTEELVAGLWADLLKLDRISVFDNFFELGGHSLLAGRVLARVAHSTGVLLPLRALFEAPTIAALAEHIDKARAAQPSVPPREIVDEPAGGPEPVSTAQEHVLRIERELPGLPQFNLPFAYRLRGPLNVPALERSLNEVVGRHRLLRTSFAWSDELPVALVTPPGEIGSNLVIEDLTARVPVGNERAKTLLLRWAELEAERQAWKPIDTRRAPLLRARLLRVGSDDHVLLLVLHHIIVDGWSIGIFMEEVSTIYSAIAAGRQPHLPEPELQFSDFARKQREWAATTAAKSDVAAGIEHLRGASALFPTKGDDDPLLGSTTAHERFHILGDLVGRLNALSQRQDCTAYMALLLGFKILLFDRTGRNDISVATAMANRLHIQTERLIGPLANTVIVRTRIDADMSFQYALCRIRDSVLEGHARQALPFDMLANGLVEDGALDPASLVQVSFVFQNAFRPLTLPDVAVQPFAYPDGQRALPIDRSRLSMMLKESASGIEGLCTYKKDLFKPATIRRWVRDYRSILARAVANPGESIGKLAAG